MLDFKEVYHQRGTEDKELVTKNYWTLSGVTLAGKI